MSLLGGARLRLQRVDDEEARGELRYMHRNPVQRAWSAHRSSGGGAVIVSILLNDAGLVRVNAGWTKISFPNRVA